MAEGSSHLLDVLVLARLELRDEGELAVDGGFQHDAGEYLRVEEIVESLIFDGAEPLEYLRLQQLDGLLVSDWNDRIGEEGHRCIAPRV